MRDMKDTYTKEILKTLEKVVSMYYPTSGFCIGEYQEEAVCLQAENDGWVVYTGERGNRYGEARCDTLLLAVSIVFRKFTHRTEIISEMEREFLQRLCVAKKEELCMDKDYVAFLEKYIPSSDMRAKVIEIGHQFSDWDCAAIIWNSDILLKERHEDIQRIADDTSDSVLKEQILERVTYDQDALRIFTDVPEGCVYALNSHEFLPEDDIVGYYENYDLALEEGQRLGFDFSIEKHRIIKKDTVRTKGRSISSPIIEPDESKQIEEMDYYSALAEVEYDKQGRILSYWSHEIPKEREIKVNTLSNKRFENKFVVIPKIFEGNEKVRVVEMDSKSNGLVGWVNRGFWKYEDFIRKATAENAIEDYSDACLPVDYWDENRLMWDHSHILPIYLERVSEELCNSFDEDHQVIIGHDYGGAVWLQAVKVTVSDKILSDDIIEIGKEISVNKAFFDRVLKRLLVEEFDPVMTENKNRYTYAFSEEGRYLTGFEEGILENNFFTYEKIEKMLAVIEDCVKDGAWLIENRIGGKDAIQLMTFAAYVRRIMDENADLKLISVLS